MRRGGARGGGGRGGGAAASSGTRGADRTVTRRRSRSPDQNHQQQPLAAPATSTTSDNAAASNNFEVRRSVAAAFAKFPTELQGISKDAALADIFPACDKAATFDPAQGGSAAACFATLRQKLASILKSDAVAEWLVDRCQKFITPVAKVAAAPPKSQQQQQQVPQQQFPQQQVQRQPGQAGQQGLPLGQQQQQQPMSQLRFGGGRGGYLAAQQQQQQQQQQQIPQQQNSFGNMHNNSNSSQRPLFSRAPPPSYNHQQQHLQGGGGFTANNGNVPLLSLPVAPPPPSNDPLLPEPCDPRVVIFTGLSPESNNELIIRNAVDLVSQSVIKNLVCDNSACTTNGSDNDDKADNYNGRCIVFVFDQTQAIALRCMPPGTILRGCPRSRFIECDKKTYDFAVEKLRDRVKVQERLAQAELDQIRAEEQGIATTQGAENARRAKALRAQLDTARADVGKFERELALLEDLGDAIPGQAQRRETVKNEVQKRKAVITALAEELTAIDAGQAEIKRPATFSSSSQSVENQRSLIYFSGFSEVEEQLQLQQQNQKKNSSNSRPNSADNTGGADQPAAAAVSSSSDAAAAADQIKKGWSDARILAFLKHIPNAQPLHIWRSSKSSDICVELTGGPGAVFNVTNFLSYNDFRFCGIRVSKSLPSSSS